MAATCPMWSEIPWIRTMKQVMTSWEKRTFE
jgi:hypothetical protein